MMKNGGNKKLRELLDVYSLDRFKIDKKVIRTQYYYLEMVRFRLLQR